MTTEHVDPIAQLLITLINEVRETNMQLQRMNSTERTGSVSSVHIEDNPTKDLRVRVSSKTYTGSVLPVDEALEDHARLHREAEERAMRGWAETAELARNGGL